MKFKLKVIETREREIIIEANSIEDAEDKYIDSDSNCDGFEEVFCVWTGAKIIDIEESN